MHWSCIMYTDQCIVGICIYGGTLNGGDHVLQDLASWSHVQDAYWKTSVRMCQLMAATLLTSDPASVRRQRGQ